MSTDYADWRHIYRATVVPGLRQLREMAYNRVVCVPLAPKCSCDWKAIFRVDADRALLEEEREAITDRLMDDCPEHGRVAIKPAVWTNAP